tara:strand:+ start:3730 stop:4260 length:531 start_codon:yes stop_codon:yes gene_type:complete
MNNEIYYNKYLKYKNKYLQLSNKLGGSATAEARPKKKSKTTININIGEIFYVKWNMTDGTSRYYRSIVTAIDEVNKQFTLKYSLPEEDGSYSEEIRKFSEIDKDIVLRQSTYLEMYSNFPPQKVRVGKEYQADLPAFGTPSNERGRDMQPLSEEEILSVLSTHVREKTLASLKNDE